MQSTGSTTNAGGRISGSMTGRCQQLDQTATVLREHLAEINHIRAQIGAERAGFASKEALDREIAALRAIIETVETTLSQRMETALIGLDSRVGTNEKTLSNYAGRTLMLSGSIGFILVLMTIAVNVFLHFV